MPSQSRRKTLPRIPGVRRRPYHTRVDYLIEKALEKECARYNVSKSWVIRNALAFTFGIDVEPYIDVNVKKRLKTRETK